MTPTSVSSRDMTRPPVRLEPWGPDDGWVLERLMGDPAMTAHLGGPETHEQIAERQRRYQRGGSGQYKIVGEEGGEVAGWVGYWEREWQGQQVYEIGWSGASSIPGTRVRYGRGSASNRPGAIRGKSSLRPRVPICNQLGLKRHLSQAWFRACGGMPVRVPGGQPHALQRLASGPVPLSLNR